MLINDIFIKNYKMSSPKKAGFILNKAMLSPKKDNSYQSTSNINLKNSLNNSKSLRQRLSNEAKQQGFKQAIEVKDQQTYYNGDVYDQQFRVNRMVKYQQHLSQMMKSRQDHKKHQKRIESNQSGVRKQLNQKRDIPTFKNIKNIHRTFNLESFTDAFPILKSIIHELDNSNSIIRLIERYFTFYQQSRNINNTNDLKFISSQKQIISRSMRIEKEGLLVIIFCISINCFETSLNCIKNIVRIIFENYLIVLNLLTGQNNKQVIEVITEQGKQYLLQNGFIKLRTNNEIIQGTIQKIVKLDPLFTDQFNKIINKNIDNTLIISQIRTFLAFYLFAIKSSSISLYFCSAVGPYLSSENKKQYTLIIDFYRVFIDQSIPLNKIMRQKIMAVRPYTQYFLKQMSKYYEIVSFCNLMPQESNFIINMIDAKKLVSHQLYKFHIDRTINSNGYKNMKKLGRNLNRLIYLDVESDSECDNLFKINQWKSGQGAGQLAQICPLLAYIVVQALPTLDSIKKVKQKIQKNSKIGLNYINCGID